ncbi:oligosaccharide flippase family protein, partial [Bacillus sp. JJ1122]|uniref:oligosaccharide flippase family protein n=1 Tax=Bacillus sp. JJ1122 TaxID=3122951 RepID=UPI003000BE05
MNKTSFVKSSIIYTIGNLIIKGVSFFTLPIFTRLMLPGEFGKFALYTSALGIVTIFVSLQIQSSIGIAYKRYYNDQQKFNSFIGNTMLLPIIISILLIIIGSVFPSLSNFLGSNNGSLIIWTLILNALFSSFVTIFTSAMIFEQKPSKHLLYSLVYTLLNVIISVALVIYMSNDTYFARVLGILVSTTIIGLILFLQYAKYITIYKLISDWKFGLALSLPLIFHVLSQQVLSYVDRFMLDYYINENEVGIYSFVYNIGMIISLLLSSINNAW